MTNLTRDNQENFSMEQTEIRLQMERETEIILQNKACTRSNDLFWNANKCTVKLSFRTCLVREKQGQRNCPVRGLPSHTGSGPERFQQAQ